MPVSMIQSSSSYPPFGISLASSPSDLSSPPYSTATHPQTSKLSPSFSASGPIAGYIPIPCKEETIHRYPLNIHDTHHNTENYHHKSHTITNNNNGPTTIKHNINSNPDMPALNGNVLSTPFPFYNPSSSSSSGANHHAHLSHAMNYYNPQSHNNEHTTPNYSTMTNYTNLNHAPSPPHPQLATENAVAPYSHLPATSTALQSSSDLNGMDRRLPFANLAKVWNPQPAFSPPPSPPSKIQPTVSPHSSPICTNPQPQADPTRGAISSPSPSPTLSPPSRPQPPQSPPPKLRPSLPSPAGLSPPSSPDSNDSSSPSSPRGSKRRRSDQERREKHNDTERKGRQKINSEIRVLKSLLPELQNSAAPKVSVLQCAVDTIKRRTEYAASMQQQNAHLRDENKGLKTEIQRLQHLLSMASSNQAMPMHLPSVSSVQVHPNMHQMDTMDHGGRRDGYAFPGPLVPASATLISQNKQYIY